MRHVLCSTLWFLAVGPIFGAAVFIMSMMFAGPVNAAATINFLPLVILGSYFLGSIPAALTGAVLGILTLSDRIGRGFIVSFLVGAASMMLYANMSIALRLFRGGTFLVDDARAQALLLALWGGMSASLTSWAVGHIATPIEEAIDMYRRSPRNRSARHGD